MGLTLFIAQLFGASLLVVSVAMAFRYDDMMHVLDEFLKDRALLFFAALVSLMVGLLLVLIHNVWTGDLLTIVVTVLGWGLLLRGVIWLFVPGGVLRKLVSSAKKEHVYYVIVFIIFLVGSYLTYSGFTG
jgi:hypothetical protein